MPSHKACEGPILPTKQPLEGSQISRKVVEGSSNSDSSVNSDEYDFVERDIQVRTSCRVTKSKRPQILALLYDVDSITSTPSCLFPGTWESAIHDTSAAVKEVATASKLYYDAIAGSGIAKAGLSIGGAMAATANRNALVAANFAVTASGRNPEKLSAAFRNRLKGKEKLDAAKRRAAEAEKSRLGRKYMRELIERGEVVETASSSWAASRTRTPDALGYEDYDLVSPRRRSTGAAAHHQGPSTMVGQTLMQNRRR